MSAAHTRGRPGGISMSPSPWMAWVCRRGASREVATRKARGKGKAMNARLACDQAELGGARQDLDFRVRVELAAQVAKVAAYGHVANAHPGGDVAIIEPGREESQYVA